MTDEEKACRYCSKPLTRRKVGGKLEEPSKWKLRKFCNLSCSSASRTGMKYGSKEAVARALAQAPEPPCESPTRCQHYEQCAQNAIACVDFYRYSTGWRGKPGREPSREIYERVFSDIDLVCNIW